ncbi:hypothetical protein B0J13DRAFT_666678 [Dactylonectria estremocensis]|uniref:Uncharacterized protein n=1 Tax=Dactylonectria estremocensis TaxID=1079267 RepID=A0A9P9EUP2_9HYPO|nr:hypothetical protein B0J13DRAFT_666678 [Dactylonectria estremocensis]
MISMQRSLSSPVCIHSSPPVSPTITKDSTSPDPSLDIHVQPPRPRRYRSPSPDRSSDATQALPLRRSDDAARRGHAQQHQSNAAARKPLVAQPNMPAQSSPRHGPSDLAATASEASTDAAHSPFPKPLLQDVSQYTNPHLSPEKESTTLEELAHVVRLSKYQERKRANTRLRLQRSLVSTALSARLTRCGEIAHRNLVDGFRRDDKDNFTALYNAIHDVRNSCDELRRYALLDPEMEGLAPSLGSTDSVNTPTSFGPGANPLRTMMPFLHDISASARDTFLDFLTQLRTNPDYLATRICSLTSSELNAFLSYHKGLEPVESVLPFHARSAARSHASASGRSSTNVDIERLLSFQRHDPLSILIHTCFANSAGPDSSEDQRRTEIWATALARLISEPKSTGEHFLISVLNIWTAMRDWSGKSNMEWYLMKILEDGAFLLDRAEDQHGTRFNLSDWNHSDEVAAKEFYERAVNQLFELVDDEDATGIPEGLLELGNAVLRKLDNKYVENTSRWLVWRCLFFVFLLGVIIHPESYGMLAEYHITPYAREKILKKVAMKAHEYVSSMWSGKPSATCVPVDVPPKIKGHVESILARFQGSKSKVPAAKLLPARSITSLRETMEVHPYLVISPADLATLVNAIFPERRPHSATSGSLRSGPASISGMSAISQPISMTNPRQNFETASIISTSASSVFSDATASRDGFMDEGTSVTPQRYSPPAMDPEMQKRLNKYEDDGYRLRLAIHEMTQNLGADTVRGTCHPCAERWVVLFISSDGKSLSTHMTFDPEDELDDEENSSSTDTDEDDVPDGPELDKDYHQLRDSILRLVQDYEIPRSLEPESGRTQLSNRASGLKRYKSKTKIITPERSMASRNPYRKQGSNGIGAEFRKDAVSGLHSGPKDDQPEAVLITMLKAASAQSKALADFVSSHEYWKTLNQLNALASPSLRENGFAVLINIFSRGPRDSIRRSAAAIEEYDAWLVWLKQSQERHEGLIDRMMKRVRAMRNKMWYVTDVRNSKEYTHSRDICQALKTMGMPRRWDSFQRSRANMARVPNSSYLYRAESQIMDLLAASEEQGGPNKLSDDQAETTSLWLQKYGIENFCQGEERIHRFACEVDKCISKLVGETIREAPVLWSSELYKRDKVSYDRTRAREREHSWAGDDSSASVISEQDRRFASSTSRPSSFARDLRNLSLHNPSQNSLDSVRQSLPRATSALSDILDGQEYFDRASPAHMSDSMSTFWSPFQPVMTPSSGASRAYSPTTSLTNVSTTFSHPPYHAHTPSTASYSTGRPGTAASSNETVFQQRGDDEKTRFLADLKQSLTSLLLSDLGNQVFSRGSETDAWFGKLGQQCIDRKDALDRRAKRRSEIKEKRSSGRPRVIEKKKSFGNLRGAGEPTPDRPTEVPETPSISFNDVPPTNDSTPRLSAVKEVNEFPFKKSYQRLLNMFCVHPNPYAKLNALHELENLIIASLNSSSHKRPRWNRSDAGSSVIEDHANNARPTPLEGTIDNIKERRSQAIQSQLETPLFAHQSRQSSSETRSIMSGGAANTDAITKELQALFREAEIRPKTLFRDLQFIASFVPPSVLDKPERGKAFWNTALAALRLKSEVCRTMVEMADEVVAAHTHVRKAHADSGPSEVPQSSTGTPPPPSTTYKLDDAGKMWAITAKEGFPTAQRELALFYLSNPEYVERTTLPLSKPREVFKQAVMDMYGRSERSRMGPGGPSGSGHGLGSGGGGARGSGGLGGGPGDGKEGDVRSDPGLMCVAVHWMEAAEHGGDELATSFLRQNEFMGLG